MMSSSLPLPLPLPLHSFPDDLKAAINQLLAAYPPAESVIQALVAHYESHEPLLKRQRLQSSAETTTTSKTPTVNALDIMASTLEKNAGKFLFSVKPLPFVTPRKRLELRLFKKHLGLFNPTTTTVEGGAALADIHTIICVPTPNKLKPHFTIALLLSTNAVTTTATTSTSAAAAATFPSSDAFVFGFEAVGNSIVVCDENNRKLTVPGSGFRDTHDAIKFVLKKSTGREIVEPNSTTFKSSKSSKAQSVFHLDCHLGTKEGTLYLLPNGIFFGFKKPVLYITHDSINFVNITSKTSKTFNLIVQVGDEDKDGKAYEFCMIEINDFDGVISYVDKSKSKWASASPSTADTHIKREKSCSEDDDDTMDTSAVALPIPPSISSFANFKFEEDEDEDEDFHGGAGAGSDGDDDELLEYTEGEEEIGSEDTDEDSSDEDGGDDYDDDEGDDEEGEEGRGNNAMENHSEGSYELEDD